MALNRGLIALAGAMLILLAGCQDEQETQALQVRNAELQEQNIQLLHQLTQQTGQQHANLAYYDKLAGIAAGCDWLVPLCPASIAEPGRSAQAAGYGGGLTGAFWMMFILKLAALGAFVGGLVGMAASAWARVGRPAADAVFKAERLVAEANGLAQAAQARAGKAALAAEAAERDGQAAQHQLNQLLLQVAAEQQALISTNRDVAEAQAAHAALDAFN